MQSRAGVARAAPIPGGGDAYAARLPGFQVKTWPRDKTHQQKALQPQWPEGFFMLCGVSQREELAEKN